ncbi:hypothetical protein SEVIR_9G383600v4 [Setaria viridis]|uniref:RING-type E3 ubiquitin transferase n=4 Tax=Setaria TaxID=4554 RepID=A0A368SPY8_SETIT|nr:hypothetical protein SETIT_9G378400v2 [Setaria italica]TKV95767.1 hypothetical protein SEVIR_9G383600v2 [Setaria viridis]
MAPAPPATTWPHRHGTFLRPLALVLAMLRPVTSQLLQPPPGATLSAAFSPPSPPADAGGGGGGGGRFSLTTSLLFVSLIAALFLLAFFSAYLRRCSDAATATDAARRRALSANAAVAAAAAAAFASAASVGGGRRRAAVGLDAAAMEALPVLTYATARAVKAGRGALECAVCLSEFDDAGEKLRLLPGCCHVFHAACIDVWLAAHVTCPVCRADLSDPAVADAGHVLAADLAAQAEAPTDTIINIDIEPSESTPERGPTSSDEQPAETAEERVDRYTLRLPERLRREIDEARRLRRAMSAVTASTALPSASSGRLTPAAALRTMSTARQSRRWSGLFRALSGSRRRSEPEGHRRVVPLHTGDGEVEVVVVQDGNVEKYYAHSLTFAGFVIDGDVAAGDWNPEVFQVSTAGAATSQR